MVTFPQLSVAVNVGAIGILSQSTKPSSGKSPVNTGGVVSWTVIVWTWVLSFPQVSVAVQVLVNV